MIIFLHPMLSLLRFFFTSGVFSTPFYKNRTQCASGKVRCDTMFTRDYPGLSCSVRVSAHSAISLRMCLYKPLGGKLGHSVLLQSIWEIVMVCGWLLKLLVPWLRGSKGAWLKTHQLTPNHPLAFKNPNYSLSAFTLNTRGLARTLSSDMCYCSHMSLKSLFWHFWAIEMLTATELNTHVTILTQQQTESRMAGARGRRTGSWGGVGQRVASFSNALCRSRVQHD